MIRRGGPLVNITRRGFSSTSQQRFLSRIRLWPFERRPEPVSYRLQIVRPRFHGIKLFARGAVRFLIITSVVYYLLPVSVEVSVENEGHKAVAEDGSKGEEPTEYGEYAEDEIDEEEAGLFIPVSWPVETERTFYRGTDPEWQSYVKFAKDKESQKRAHQAVVMLCRQAFIDVPELAKSIGTVNVDKGKFWLEVDFPLGPPPEYEQIGIEFSSSFIALAAQTLSQEDYNQLCRYFDPSTLFYTTRDTAYSVIHAAKSFFDISKERLEQLRQMKKSSTDSDGSEQASISVNPRSIGPVGTMGPINVPSRDITRKGRGQTAGLGSSIIQNDHQPRGQDANSSAQDEQSKLDKYFAMQQLARSFFARPFSQPMDVAPPRGSIVLGGLVECHGANYVATVDVIAAWDLEDEQIVMSNAKIRHITPPKIAPHPATRMPSYKTRRPPPGSVGSAGPGEGGPPVI